MLMIQMPVSNGGDKSSDEDEAPPTQRAIEANKVRGVFRIFMATLCNTAGHCIFVHVVSSSLWSPYIIGQTIIFLPCDFYLLSIFFFYFLA